MWGLCVNIGTMGEQQLGSGKDKYVDKIKPNNLEKQCLYYGLCVSHMGKKVTAPKDQRTHGTRLF